MKLAGLPQAQWWVVQQKRGSLAFFAGRAPSFWPGSSAVLERRPVGPLLGGLPGHLVLGAVGSSLLFGWRRRLSRSV